MVLPGEEDMDPSKMPVSTGLSHPEEERSTSMLEDEELVKVLDSSLGVVLQVPG